MGILKELASDLMQDEAAFLTKIMQARRFSVKMPDVLNFVWVGNCDRADFTYLSVWKKFNPQASLQVWTDDASHYCSGLQQCLLEGSSDPERPLLSLRNAAFDYIYKKTVAGYCFNSAAASFLKINRLANEDVFPEWNKCGADYIPAGAHHRDINALFEGEFRSFRKIYYYELILRGNFAAASDIVRLLILYRFGGFYIDLDTLPEISYLFRETRAAEIAAGVENEEHLCLAKSAAFLGWYHNRKDWLTDVAKFIRAIPALADTERTCLSESLERDVSHISQEVLKPLGDVYAHPDFLMAGAVSFLPGTFFNNMMCAAEGSRLIKLILKHIAGHYRYLENRGFLASPGEESGNAYRSFLCGYRHDAGTFSDPLTLRLTGPGAIADAIVKLIYRLAPQEKHIPVSELGKRLQKDDYQLVIKKQTLDTPMGLK